MTISQLIDRVREEAQRAEFPIDIPVYQEAKLEPTYPVLYAGNLNSPLCVFGRDLGKDEVQSRQPLIGASGTMVREGFYYSIHQQKASSRQELDKTTCDRLLLTNTVPYKPPGNKAYSMAVKERFRPYVASLLVFYWQGNQIITLGTEACKWFAPYREKGEVDKFFTRSDRFEAILPLTLTATDSEGITHQKPISLLPLPHPSPLNKQYYAVFPRMLQHRLGQVEF
jgi:uracil-DNA glycosylase